MNWETIKSELGLDSTHENCFLTSFVDDDFGDIPRIVYELESPFYTDSYFQVCELSFVKGNVTSWADDEEKKTTPEEVLKFMKEENYEPDPLDPSVMKGFKKWKGEKNFVSLHGWKIRFQNEDCTFFFDRRFIWGNERPYGFTWFAKAGEPVCMKWQESERIFTFENALEWLRNSGYTYRKDFRK